MPLATVRTIWTVCRRCGWRLRRPVELLAGQLPPAEREVILDVREGGTAQPRGDVVPAQAGAGPDGRCVVPVAGLVGHVDAADKGDFAVDDHRLFVWQWNGCSRGSASQRIRVPRIKSPTPSRISFGWGETPAPARPPTPALDVHLFGRLGQQLAEHPGRSPRTSSKYGAMCHPATRTYSRARSIACAISGTPAAVDEHVERQPARGGGSPTAHNPSSGLERDSSRGGGGASDAWRAPPVQSRRPPGRPAT